MSQPSMTAIDYGSDAEAAPASTVELPCPGPDCKYVFHDSLKSGTKGINTHWTTMHKGVRKTESHASALKLGFCSKCDKFVRLTTENKLFRHTGCVSQTQPLTAQAKKDFAQKKDEISKEQHTKQVRNMVEPTQPVSRRAEARNWSRGFLLTLSEYAAASRQKDTPRMETLLKALIESSAGRRTARRRSSSKVHDIEASIRRAINILRSTGRAGKAMAALRASGVLEITPEVESEIRRLYPKRTVDLNVPDDTFTNPDYEIELDAELVGEILRTKDRHTGRGFSNLGYGDLQSLLDESGFLANLTILLQDLVNCRIGRDSEAMAKLLTARGVPIAKLNGKPRPIGVREVLINLALSVAVRQEESNIKNSLSDDDFGFKVKDGAALPAHRALALLERARYLGVQLVIVKLDIKNAYGTTFRASVLDVLLKTCPKMVRAFLATHQVPHQVIFPGMDPVHAAEGLTQGDPAAPAYAQLLYGHLCQIVRDKLNPEFLASFFDDIFVIDTFENAMAVVDELVPLFAKHGLEISLEKCLMYSEHELNHLQLRRVDELGIKQSSQGIVILGTPVGSEHFIRNHLRKEVDDVLEVLRKISRAAELGRTNSVWATSQGLYHLTRDCANQLLRHLLRTVEPTLTIDEFKTVDDATMSTVLDIFDIMESDELVSDVIRSRIRLPGSLGGLGVTAYVTAAPCAYLGCIMSVGRRLALIMDDPGQHIPGYHQALKILDSYDDMPSAEAFFHAGPVDNEPTENTKHLSRKLLRWRQDKERARLDEVATGYETFFLRVTSHETCADFLYAPIVDPRNRMYRTFSISVKLYLGLPVAPALCNIESCNNVPVHRFGAHGNHCQGKLTKRHHDMRDRIIDTIKHLSTAHDTKYEVLFEYPLKDLGFAKLPNAPNPQEARCDFALVLEQDNYCVVTDVTICHPNPDKPCYSTTPLLAAQKAEKQKYDRYCKNYKIDAKNVKPIVFETFGGWSRDTTTFLHDIVTTIAGGDAEIFAKAWRLLRNRIAVILAKGEAEVILALRSRNHVPIGLSMTSPRQQPRLPHASGASATTASPTTAPSPSTASGTAKAPRKTRQLPRLPRASGTTATAASSTTAPPPSTATATARTRQIRSKTKTPGDTAESRRKPGSAS
jgi:hypothetical protein